MKIWDRLISWPLVYILSRMWIIQLEADVSFSWCLIRNTRELKPGQRRRVQKGPSNIALF